VYLALIRLQGFTVKQMVNPWRAYVRLSAVLMGSNGLTKGSLAFLNYPAQIMFKSTKVKSYRTYRTIEATNIIYLRFVNLRYMVLSLITVSMRGFNLRSTCSIRYFPQQVVKKEHEFLTTLIFFVDIDI
jgi:hypothetical protein